MSELEALNRRIADDHAARDEADLRATLDTSRGRRILWSVLAQAGVYGRSFTGDALSTAYNEGRREVGIALLERVERSAPGAYLKMMKEALDEAALIENSRKQAAANDARASE